MNVSEVIRAASRPWWRDKYYLRLNTPPTANQDVWIRNPTFKNATSGAMAVWVRFPEVLTGNGFVTIQALGNAGAAEYMLFTLRRNTARDAPTNVIDVLTNIGGLVKGKSGTTTLAANTWYLVGHDSLGDQWVNGSKEGVQHWYGSSPTNVRTSGWYSDLPGVTKDLSFGALRHNGTTSFYGRNDINDPYEFSAPLTAPEWAELYAAGMGCNPRSLSPGLQAKIIDVWSFEQTLVPPIGTDTLTAANVVLADYKAH